MPLRNLGYACINLSLNEGRQKKDRVYSSRTIREKSFSLDKVNDLILLNSIDLLKILKWNAENDIYFFRISSEMFPFIDHPNYLYSISDLRDAKEIKEVLKDCGDFAERNRMRLTTHPGPYNCLASPKEDVVKKTVLSIESHKNLAELLGLDDFCINIHVGGTYGDFEGTSTRFNNNFSLLSEKSKKWLTIENDDKASMWSVSKLNKYISSEIGVPIVLDIHHWSFCKDEALEDAAKIAFSTWKDRIPKVHYSESANNKRAQAHSDYIFKKIPVLSNDFLYDIMIEAKAKDKALVYYRKTVE
jgi:UV DNA damage endonuclease